MQCTYNVAARRVRTTIIVVENNKYLIFPVCVFVALGIRREMRMRHIVICGLFSSILFFHNISQTTRFSTKAYWTQNVCFDILYNVCLKYFSP